VIDAGWTHPRWLRHDPDWSHLHADHTFQALLARIQYRRDSP
jgi:hypothetical protein